MKNLMIGTRLFLGFGIVILLYIITNVIGISTLTQNERELAEVQKVHAAVDSASKVVIDILSIVDTTKAIVISENPEEKQRLLSKIGEYRKAYKGELEILAKNTSTDEGKQLLTKLQETMLAGKSASLKVIDLGMKGDKAEFSRVYELECRPTNDAIFQICKQLQDYYNKYSAMHNDNAVRSGQTAKIGIIVFCLVVVLLCVVICVIITRSITRPIHKCIDVANTTANGDLTVAIDCTGKDETALLMTALQQMVTNLRDMISKTVEVSTGIATASNQLHATSSQIASGADNLASQTNTVATASEEMSATSNDIARSCALAAEASQHSTDAANAGASVVQETISGMDLIADRVQQSSVTILALGTRSEQIGAIVGTIEDIADQTNLLALNAAIEAARAGEQGRGFAVVADEVRALAERTTKATREIGEMIKAIQGETSTAVKAMQEGVRQVEKGAVSSQKSGQALEAILTRIGEVSMQVSQIATAAEEQTATTGEVTGNIQQITEVVQLTATGASETANAAAQLAQQAGVLQELVGRFTLV
jgi:methyl-accepting chemotaxis protein